MKSLRTFFIALPIAWILSFQVAPAFWHGVALADIFALVTGNVAFYVNPSASPAACGINGGSSCQPGNDSHSCLTISAPCATFQHAAYLLTQTLVWGVNVGAAQIYLADATMNEIVTLGGTIGFPKGGYAEVIGDDAASGNVVLSAPNGGCPAVTSLSNAVLTFASGSWVIHGFTVTAVNEVTNACSDVDVEKGASVNAAGVMNYGPPAKGSFGAAAVLNVSGDYYNSTMNVAAGNGRASQILNTGTGGSIWLDFTTINFVGTNNVTGGVYGASAALFSIPTPGGWITTPTNVTFSGAIGGNCYYVNGGRSYMEAGESTSSWAGCTPAGTTATQVGNGATFGNTVVAGKYATSYGAGGFPSTAIPTLTSCGSSPSFNTRATDSSGTFTLGSGASACTLVFDSVEAQLPDCVITPFAGATFSYGGINGTAGTYTGFTITASTGKFSYWCGHHL